MSKPTQRHLGRNDLCHCGSTKKYKHCHWKDDQDRGKQWTYESAPITPLTDLASLRKNTLDLIQCLRGDLGIHFDHRSGQGSVTAEISDGVVLRTYDRIPYFFPHEAPYNQICEEIGDSQFSGFYWGNANVNNVATHLVRYALYTPHIVISNPFCDLWRYSSDVSPLDRPRMWRQQVVNRAIFLVSIEPWIREGVITVLPPVKWTDYELYNEKIKPVAKARFAVLDEEQRSSLELNWFLNLARSFHPNDLPAFVDSYMQDAPDELIESVLQIVHEEYATNPIRYQWTGNDSVVSHGSGNNLESAVFTSSLCRSYLLFGEDEYRKEYRYAIQKAGSESSIPKDALTQLSHAFAALNFPF